MNYLDPTGLLKCAPDFCGGGETPAIVLTPLLLDYLFVAPGWAFAQQPGQEIDTLRLHNKLNAVLRRQVSDAIKGLNGNCQRDLTRHNIDLNDVAAKAGTTEYYSASFEGNIHVNELVLTLSGNMLSKELGNNLAVTLSSDNLKVSNKVVVGDVFFKRIVYGNDLATSQNITLVHEALHVGTGAFDIDLAQKMGLGAFQNSAAASEAISRYLEGCYQ